MSDLYFKNLNLNKEARAKEYTGTESNRKWEDFEK